MQIKTLEDIGKVVTDAGHIFRVSCCGPVWSVSIVDLDKEDNIIISKFGTILKDVMIDVLVGLSAEGNGD